jgi:hydrogenase nickel incorporation protein HypA/HybF
MHELSLAHAVVSTVSDALPGRTVLSVRLRIGVLSGVVPEALAFGWELATSGTALAGATLQVVREPLPGRCLDCDAESVHERPPPLTCPHCGGRVLPVDAAAARALEVESVEVDDEPPAAGMAPVGDDAVSVDDVSRDDVSRDDAGGSAVGGGPVGRGTALARQGRPG